MRKTWLPSEDALLIQYYKSKGARYLAQLLDRTPKSVSIRAKRLKWTRKTIQYWSEEETNALLTWTDSLVAFAEKFSRTKEAVRRKARKLGIDRQFPGKRYPHYSHLNFEPSVLAYAAGILDGEGMVTLKVNEGKRRWRFHPVITVRVLAESRVALDFCRDKLKLGSVRIGSDGQRSKSIASWNCYGTAALTLAKVILPYSKIKTRHLELLIQFLESRLTHSPNVLTREELESVIEISELNARRQSIFTKVKKLKAYLRVAFPPGVDSIRVPTHPQ